MEVLHGCLKGIKSLRANISFFYKKKHKPLYISNICCIFAPDFTWSIACATSDDVLVEHYAMTYVSPQSKQPEAWFTPGTPIRRLRIED